MRLYDLILVLKASLSETERKKLLDDLRGRLKDVKITDEEWGQKPLAYKIKRELAGFYHIMKLESEKGLNEDLEKKLRTDDNVLRYLLLRKK